MISLTKGKVPVIIADSFFNVASLEIRKNINRTKAKPTMAWAGNILLNQMGRMRLANNAT